MARTRQKWERERWLPGFHWPLWFTVWGGWLYLAIAILMLLTIGIALIFNPSFVVDR